MVGTPRIRKCAFSTADDRYAGKAVVSLLSFAIHNPGFDLHLVGTRFGSEARALCDSHGITLIELDLSKEFHMVWEYPRECYYHFKAPELFAVRGYDQSVYLDGDTYCNDAFQPDVNESHIAGVSYDTVGSFFKSIGEPNVAELAGLDMADTSRPRIQSGVLVLRNRELNDLDYFGRVVHLYDHSIRVGWPRRGDDSLLALLLMAYPQIGAAILPRRYNLVDFHRDGSQWLDLDDDPTYHCSVYHFVAHKPWELDVSAVDRPHLRLRDRWLDVMRTTFNRAQVAYWFPDVAALDNARASEQ